MGDMIYIHVEGKKYEYPSGVRLKEISDEFQSQYNNSIILARVDGQLRELLKPVRKDARIEWVTVADSTGQKTYGRTATFILTKAVSDVLGKEYAARLIVQFSVDKGYYCELMGKMPIDPGLLEQIKRRMEEIVLADLSIEKHSIKTRDAIRLFRENGMVDKQNLFKYRRSSWVNIYQMEDVIDYYYGYMAPSAGYIRYFDLIPYHDGFVMQMPAAKNPEKVPVFKPSEKIYSVLKESTLWGDMLGVSNVGELNDCISSGGFMDLMLVQEALQEKNIGAIAEEIYRSRKRIVLIAGPSSSGKTTFSHRLSVQLRAKGMRPHPIQVDDYFIDREQTPRDADGKYNFECIEALNVKRFNEDMNRLLEGERVELPIFNFISGKSEYGKGNFKQIGADDVLVIEGIHCLNDALTYSIPKKEKYKIYISALTQLNIDEHNRIPTTDGRLIRRIVRDAAKRGSSAAHTISMWPSVRRGEEDNIFPYQEDADVMFNSALIYELSVLKQFAEPLLFSIHPDMPEYDEAKRLLKFLDYFVGVTSENLPKNSILREFIGGSYFNV